MNKELVNTDEKELRYHRLDDMMRNFERIFSILTPIIAIVLALFVVGLFIRFQGASPIEAYVALFNSAFGTPYNIATSLNRATPLILTAMGIAIASRGGMINLGGEGQIILGGITGAIAALYFSSLPAFLLIPLILTAGFLGGALWGLLPGYFHAKHGTNLIITTILLNDIAIGVLGTLLKGPLKEKGGMFPQSALIDVSAQLPILLPQTRLHAGFIIAIIITVLAYVMLLKTPYGFDIRLIGENSTAAIYSGLKVFKTKIFLMLIAGGCAGLAGSVEIIGFQYRLREGFLLNYGYEALAVALLGQKHPVGVLIAGILFGALKAGRGGMVRMVDLPVSISLVLSGIIILFVAISPILMKIPRYLILRDFNRKCEEKPSVV